MLIHFIAKDMISFILWLRWPTVYIHHIFFLVIGWWTSRLISCLSYCEFRQWKGSFFFFFLTSSQTTKWHNYMYSFLYVLFCSMWIRSVAIPRKIGRILFYLCFNRSLTHWPMRNSESGTPVCRAISHPFIISLGFLLHHLSECAIPLENERRKASSIV